jgi:phosphoenolpyruvate carboxylase
MRRSLDAFQEHVALKYQIYNGLFLSLPFEDVRQAGIMLPLFAEYCREQLEMGAHPSDIVHTFFEQRMGSSDRDERVATLFRFMQIIERQVVLFDALEDAAFEEVNDMKGPGTLKDMLGRVENDALTEELKRYLEEFRVRVVLTAHPTQFYPDEILGIITDLPRTLRDNRSLHPRVYTPKGVYDPPHSGSAATRPFPNSYSSSSPRAGPRLRAR